uniref:zinc finger and SCAN domain-containing protein 31-like isoform X2 n=1 Tax=Semicossyphus pulcher TaxID=241346 RepID=UPI0037E947B7
MSGFQDLKDLFRRRLLAAVIRDEAGQTSTSGYEEELHRQRKLLDVILTPEIKLQRADVQQLLVIKKELPPEQQEWSPSLNQEDTKPPHIKEEQEELWISQEGEQLQGLGEADTNKFPFTIVTVKSEDDEEKPQSSQLHQRQTEQMETGADGEDCGGAEPARNSDPERHLQPETEVKTEDSSEPETEDSDDDWKDTREHQSGLNSVDLKNKRPENNKKSHSCSECGETFKEKQLLTRHMRIHTGGKPFSCSECSKTFSRKGDLTTHMNIHLGDKSLSCSECGKKFKYKKLLTRHMLVHTEEKLFSCSKCGKRFKYKQGLTNHMRLHTVDYPWTCFECGKKFICKLSLTYHMLVHTREKSISCSECGNRF